MNALFEKQDMILRNTDMHIVRNFINDINWEAPMLCIRGARGVGKSTLLAQYIKLHYDSTSHEALYCSLDWVYFAQHSMLEVADNFYKMGGKLLVFDEVHKYENWSREAKEISEVYPSLRIVLSGSSLLNILNGNADLSRRCRMYDMPGLSFREYLKFYHNIDVPVFSLEELLRNPYEAAEAVNVKCRPLMHFHEYLKKGFYPFYLRNKADYYPLIEQTINYVIEVELPQLRKVDVSNLRKIKALLNVLANIAPFEVDIKKLGTITELQRSTVIDYLRHMQDAKILNLLYNSQRSIKKLQKPDKIYLENPNLLYALSTDTPNIGTVRECFVINQLGHKHCVEYGKSSGDFVVDGVWTFEVGGPGKSYEQIADIPNSFILADDVEMPFGDKLPIWLIGLTY